jgi:hypothetical protein
METQVQNKTHKSWGFIRKLIILTIAGAVIFWATTISTSLLPIAAEYRAAYSNWSIQAVWVDSLVVGLVFGCWISLTLYRFVQKNPTKSPILKSLKQSAFALIIITLLVDVPRSIIGPNHSLYYFFIGLMFNLVRFLLLGLTIGYLYKKLYRSANADRNKINPPAISSVAASVDIKIGDKNEYD